MGEDLPGQFVGCTDSRFAGRTELGIQFGQGFEDTNLFLHLALVARIHHIAEPLVRHRRHAGQYSADAQARSVVGLIEELGLTRPVLAGYDIGSRIAQTVARLRPDLVRALVVAPPVPGIGDRILSAAAQTEFWYQAL